MPRAIAEANDVSYGTLNLVITLVQSFQTAPRSMSCRSSFMIMRLNDFCKDT